MNNNIIARTKHVLIFFTRLKWSVNYYNNIIGIYLPFSSLWQVPNIGTNVQKTDLRQTKNTWKILLLSL